jgi:hypothetical protein
MIMKDQLTARLAEILANLKQAEANVYALQGAAQECRNWIALDEENEQKKGGLDT